MGDTWYLDELFVTMQGRQHYLWRAGDEDGDVIDILVQSRRDRRAAVQFFRTLLKREGHVPRRLITDKLRSYAAAHRTVMPSVMHSTRQYENNRAEVSHQPSRQRERQMRRFTSAAHAQRFLSVHGVVLNLFRVGRVVSQNSADVCRTPQQQNNLVYWPSACRAKRGCWGVGGTAPGISKYDGVGGFACPGRSGRRG